MSLTEVQACIVGREDGLGQSRLHNCLSSLPAPLSLSVSVFLNKQVLLIDFPLRPDGCGKKNLQNTSVDDF